ncbi:MAG TPA: hypothetical protein VGY31_15400 [Terriglobia bacterium]|nr:hypothetical protein [Terriglobia bacterium]
MKRNVVASLAVLAFAVAMVFPVRAALRAAGTPHPTPAPRPAAAAMPAASPAPAAMPAEPHPEIRAAMAALENARNHLAHGAHDFGGHRASALDLTNQAIEQCRAALRYDRH